MTDMQPPTDILLRGDAIVDGHGVVSAPGAVLLRFAGDGGGPVVLGAGHPDGSGAWGGGSGRVRVVDRPGRVITPAFVNAHTHLDLTLLGPRPLVGAGGPGAFAGWIESIRRERPTERGAIEEAVLRGVRLSRAAGVAAVGDIAGAVGGRPSLWPAEALAAAAAGEAGAAAMQGVSFVEFFALGRGAAEVAGLLGAVEAHGERVAAGEGGRGKSPVRVGLSPHAPYSVGPAGYGHAGRLARAGWAVTSHVAESMQEHELVMHGTGPMREFLERLGLWTAAVAADVRRGRSAVMAVLGELLPREAGVGGGPVSLVHLNRCDDDDLDALAGAAGRGALSAVVYCPRASAYFRAPELCGPHRYREMLARGLAVAIGTDSIVGLEPGAADPAAGLFGPLAELRLLHRRDGTDPGTLLAMATVHGARALGLNPAEFLFPRGVGSGGGGHQMVGVVTLAAEAGGTGVGGERWLEEVMRNDEPPEVVGPYLS